MQHIVKYTWDGMPLPREQWAYVTCETAGRDLAVCVDSPFYGDPPPPAPPGPRDQLWTHEVVELFLLGSGDRYLEIELGPWGHYWVLELQGYRRPVRTGLEIAFEAQLEDDRWCGRARVPGAVLPPGLRAANAYAIHGEGDARRYLAAHPVPGREPDFHRIERFPACTLPVRRG